MAIQVPSEPKIYTTVYDNFKGVDFTNDATNVYRRRSPDGKNMLPDIDGRPYKRTGWEVEVTANDFIDALNMQGRIYPEIPYGTAVEPDRVFYFELDGYDWAMIFNSLGVFSYSASPLKWERYGKQIGDKYLVYETPYNPDSEGYYEDSFPDTLNSNTAFFFEGNGDAGFYVLCGLDLYKFDGYEFRQVEPKVPQVLVLSDPQGVGTPLEGLNLLTRKRTVGYACDGSTTTYVLPGGFNDPENIWISVRDPDTGEWLEYEDITQLYSYTPHDGLIDFSPAPLDVVKGEDNMLITYIPAEGTEVIHRDTVNLPEKYVTIRQVAEHIRTRGLNSQAWSDWSVTAVWYDDCDNAVYSTPNILWNYLTNQQSISLEVRNPSDTAWVSLYPTVDPSLVPSASETNKTTPKVDITSYSYGSSSIIKPTKYLWNSKVPKEILQAYYVDTEPVKANNQYSQKRTTYNTYRYRIKGSYTSYEYWTSGTAVKNPAQTAFSKATRSIVFGNGIVNQIFMTASSEKNYNTRVWWSAANDPSYFPELNYIEVGSNDTPIKGLMKVGDYLGVVKSSSGTATSVYLAYPTSFADDTTYAVKQSINGVGAIANGAFNTLEDEPLFLSPEGVMAIEPSDTDRQLRNRSYFVNKKLLSEPNIANAFSFVYDGMYWLAVNNHVYVLDGSQKNSWANTKTNLQYEAYYLDNVPAQCFARIGDDFYFTDFKGDLCRFRKATEDNPYRDGYTPDADWISTNHPDGSGVISGSYLTRNKKADESKWAEVGDTVLCEEGGTTKGYTITEVDPATPGVVRNVKVTDGVPIESAWSTISDDDGAVHFFKNLKKKGSLVSLLPSSDSGVEIYLKPDRKEPIFVCESDEKQTDIPFDVYMKKKIKKYKRLQIICKNSTLDDSFGVDQIIKCYTMGNYSKNRG